MMFRTHLAQKVLCSRLAPPKRGCLRQIFKNVCELHFSTRRFGQSSQLPGNIRMCKDEISQCPGPESRLIETWRLSRALQLARVNLRPYHEESRATLRDKSLRIENDRIDCVPQPIQGQQGIVKISPVMRREETRDVLEQDNWRPSGL